MNQDFLLQSKEKTDHLRQRNALRIMSPLTPLVEIKGEFLLEDEGRFSDDYPSKENDVDSKLKSIIFKHPRGTHRSISSFIGPKKTQEDGSSGEDPFTDIDALLSRMRLDKDLLNAVRVPPLQLHIDCFLSNSFAFLKISDVERRNHDSALVLTPREAGTEGEVHALLPKCRTAGDDPEGHAVPAACQVPLSCVACGLEFASLLRLTHHLTRHVLEGLYAAQWLTQAIDLLEVVTPSAQGDLT